MPSRSRRREKTQLPTLKKLVDDEAQEFCDLRQQMRLFLENKYFLQRQQRPLMALNRSKEDNTLCWFHQMFGSKARLCRSPCVLVGKRKGRGNEYSIQLFLYTQECLHLSTKPGFLQIKHFWLTRALTPTTCIKVILFTQYDK